MTGMTKKEFAPSLNPSLKGGGKKGHRHPPAMAKDV